MLKSFMNTKVQDMTVKESIKYSGLMSVIGVVFTLVVYAGMYVVLKIKNEI